MGEIEIRNLTHYTVEIVRDGEVIFLAEQDLSQISAHPEPKNWPQVASSIQSGDQYVDVYIHTGAVGLPRPRKNVLLIVDDEVRVACPGRLDLLSIHYPLVDGGVLRGDGFIKNFAPSEECRSDEVF